MSWRSWTCRSASPAAFWGSIARRSARCRGASRRGGADRGHHRAGRAVRPLRLPPDHGAAAGGRLGGEPQARRADLAAGGAEGAARSNRRRAGSGSTTDPASVCGRSARTTSGPTTSSRTGPTMGGSSACSTSSTSSPASAWPSGWPASSTRPTSSTCWRTSSSSAACRATSGPTMGRSSSPRRCGTGSRPSAPRPPTSSPAALGERLLRELQLQAPRRAAQRRDLLQPRRGEGRHRKLAAALQHQAPALLPGLPAASPRGRPVAGFATRSRFAGHPGRSAQARHALRLNPDHPMGAGLLPLRPGSHKPRTRSVLASRPVASAKRRACRGLTLA